MQFYKNIHKKSNSIDLAVNLKPTLTTKLVPEWIGAIILSHTLNANYINSKKKKSMKPNINTEDFASKIITEIKKVLSGGALMILLASNAMSEGLIWDNMPPEGCPFKVSENYNCIEFTGRHVEYPDIDADTWYPSWASDGNMYSCWTDGESADGDRSVSFNQSLVVTSEPNKPGTTGQARIEGDDPLKLKIINLGHMEESAGIDKLYPDVKGRYPCASLVYNGVWYYGTYGLFDMSGTYKGCDLFNWTQLRAFVGFRYSSDFNHRTTKWSDGFWTPCPIDPEIGLFKEDYTKAQVKIGVPHFVDFGKNMQHSPDGKAYLVAHGSTEPAAYNSWIQGDKIYLIRVAPTIKNINNSAAYEFYTGNGKWSNNFKDIKPLIEWDGHLGNVSMTYNAPLKKYFMCISRAIAQAGRLIDTMILESDSMIGPWKMVHYLPAFGPGAYFTNIPSKFISSDGKTMWLSYSANYPFLWFPEELPNPPGCAYHFCLREFKLVDEKPSKLVLKPLSGKVEAEKGIKCGAMSTTSNFFDLHASGKYSVGYMDHVGKGLLFKNVAALNKIIIWYASSAGSKISLYINGKHEKDLNFKATGKDFGLGAYKDMTIEDLNITEGSNIKLQNDTGEPGVNIDYIQFLKSKK